MREFKRVMACLLVVTFVISESLLSVFASAEPKAMPIPIGMDGYSVLDDDQFLEYSRTHTTAIANSTQGGSGNGSLMIIDLQAEMIITEAEHSQACPQMMGLSGNPIFFFCIY